jgi:hypothetical protein
MRIKASLLLRVVAALGGGVLAGQTTKMQVDAGRRHVTAVRSSNLSSPVNWIDSIANQLQSNEKTR